MSSDQPTSLLDIVVRRVDLDPSTPLLLTISSDGSSERILSYGEVLERARTLAGALGAAGVGPGDRVGCYLSNSQSWVVASFAVWLRGAAVGAVGTLLPAPEASALFELAGAKVVIALDGAPELGPGPQVFRVDEDGSLVETDGVVRPVDRAEPTLPRSEDLALVIFTSGTTGKAKGITHTHGDVVAAARRVAAGYARTSDYRPAPAPAHLPPGVVFNPFGHMAGYSRLAFRMWIGRPTVILARFTVPAAKALLSRYAMDTLQLTPTMIHMLATSEEELDLGAVKYVTSGTAPLSIDTASGSSNASGSR